MSGLVLKLGPKERVLVNGAVIENGDRRVRLSIKTPDARILRLRDAIHPTRGDDARPPRLLPGTAVALGRCGPEQLRDRLLHRIEELSQVLRDPDSRALLAQAGSALLQDEHYQCLKALRALLPREERLLAHRESA